MREYRVPPPKIEIIIKIKNKKKRREIENIIETELKTSLNIYKNSPNRKKTL
jgi:hypothetical protein